MPPVEPLIRWVELRGIQGLTGSRVPPARAMARALRAAGGVVKVNEQRVLPVSVIRQLA